MSYYYSNEPKGSFFADGSSCHLGDPRQLSAFACARRASVSPVRPGFLGVEAQRGQAEPEGKHSAEALTSIREKASCRRKSLPSCCPG